MFNVNIKELWNVEIEESDILYHEMISDWSWGGLLIVYCQNGHYFVNDDFDSWSPREVSQEEALTEMLDFELLMQ